MLRKKRVWTEKNRLSAAEKEEKKKEDDLSTKKKKCGKKDQQFRQGVENKEKV